MDLLYQFITFYTSLDLLHQFITQGDVRYLKDIETFYNTQIDEMPLDVADLI